MHLFETISRPLCAVLAALHRLVTLGTVLGLMVWLAQSFVTERGGGYILKLCWAAPYFSSYSG